MATGTIIFLLAVVAVFFGVKKSHHQGWVAFAAFVLALALAHLAPAATNAVFDGISTAAGAAWHAMPWGK